MIKCTQKKTYIIKCSLTKGLVDAFSYLLIISILYIYFSAICLFYFLVIWPVLSLQGTLNRQGNAQIFLAYN